MKIGRYDVPSQISEIATRALSGDTDGICGFERNGIFYVAYICDANLKYSPQIQGGGHCVWLALNPTVRRLRVHLRARYRNGCITWSSSRSIKVLVRESGLLIRDGVTETPSNAHECRYGEWSQYFECKATGKEGIITECSEHQAEAHFSVICSRAPNIQHTGRQGLEEQRGTSKSIFLSHMSEDKDSIVRPFAALLQTEEVACWLDEAEISWGDNIVTKVNDGLHKATYVLCFISSAFINRNWPIAELSAALSAQLHDGVKRVLPMIVGDPDVVLRKMPILRSYDYRVWDSSTAPQLARELKALLEQS